MDSLSTYRKADTFGDEKDCNLYVNNADEYLKGRRYLWFFDNPDDLKIYYGNSDFGSTTFITAFLVTNDIKLPNIYSISTLKQLEQDVGNWDYKIGEATNAIRYAFGINYEKEIKRYSQPEIDKQFARAAYKRWADIMHQC